MNKLSGALWWLSGKRKESLQLCLWNLNCTCNSPVAPCQLSCQISANQREAELSGNVSKHWKTHAKGNEVITNVIGILHQPFRCRYSNWRDVVASSPSFLRLAARVPQRGYAKARLYFEAIYAGCELKTGAGSGNFNNKWEWDFQYLWVWDEGKIVGYWNFNQRWAESVSVCTCSPPLLSSHERQLGNDACQIYPLSSYVLFFLFWHKCCFSYSGVLKVLSRQSFQKSRRLWLRRTHMMGFHF